MGLIRNWRRKRILRDPQLTEELWREALSQLPLLANLNEEEEAKLREAATLFLHEKRQNGVQGFRPEPIHRLIVALQACLPIMNLGIDWLDGWVEVVLYPEQYFWEGESVDEAGVVHRYREIRSGEAWQHGPVVLSWDDVESGAETDGYNVVIHEIAHKLDGLNGDLDGLPPLHHGMSRKRWSMVFSAAFDELNDILDAGAEPFLDPYAAESPAEFFAVVSESFFETPWFLADYYPDLYEQLSAFYRQDPRERLEY